MLNVFAVEQKLKQRDQINIAIKKQGSAKCKRKAERDELAVQYRNRVMNFVQRQGQKPTLILDYYSEKYLYGDSSDTTVFKPKRLTTVFPSQTQTLDAKASQKNFSSEQTSSLFKRKGFHSVSARGPIILPKLTQENGSDYFSSVQIKLPQFKVSDRKTHFERSVRERNKSLEIVRPLKLAPHTDVERIVSTLSQRGAVSLGLAEKLVRDKWEVVPFKVDEKEQKQLLRNESNFSLLKSNASVTSLTISSPEKLLGTKYVNMKREIPNKWQKDVSEFRLIQKKAMKAMHEGGSNSKERAQILKSTFTPQLHSKKYWEGAQAMLVGNLNSVKYNPSEFESFFPSRFQSKVIQPIATHVKEVREQEYQQRNDMKNGVDSASLSVIEKLFEDPVEEATKAVLKACAVIRQPHEEIYYNGQLRKIAREKDVQKEASKSALSNRQKSSN